MILHLLIKRSKARVEQLKWQRREIQRAARLAGQEFPTPALDESIMQEEVDQMLMEAEILRLEMEMEQERQHDELSGRWVRALEKSQWSV